MSFVRAKEIPRGSGHWYDYEVETLHINGKVIQKHIQYLGKTGTDYHKALKGSSGLSHIDFKGGSSTPTIHKSSVQSQPQQPKVVCKLCGGQHTKKYGLYKDVTQYYYCDDCKRKFTGTDALFHHRVSPTFIASALNEYYNGLSLHDIEHNIESQTDTDISHTAIYKWINKYTDEAVRQTKDLHPKVGDTWIADETYMRVDKSKANVKNPYSKSRKAKWIVFWDIIDADTRFLLASYATTSRTKEDARILMEKAAERAGKTPKVVITDQLAAYLDGIELAYGSDTHHKQGSPFNIQNNTNLIERFHGTIKERTKVMRALKNKTTLQRFMDGWLVHYNFLRPHMSLDDKTPAEAAGLKYKNHNWADVIGYEKKTIVQELEPQPVYGVKSA